jgi:hypothetical protein
LAHNIPIGEPLDAFHGSISKRLLQEAMHSREIAAMHPLIAGAPLGNFSLPAPTAA